MENKEIYFDFESNMYLSIPTEQQLAEIDPWLDFLTNGLSSLTTSLLLIICLSAKPVRAASIGSSGSIGNSSQLTIQKVHQPERRKLPIREGKEPSKEKISYVRKLMNKDEGKKRSSRRPSYSSTLKYQERLMLLSAVTGNILLYFLKKVKKGPLIKKATKIFYKFYETIYLKGYSYLLKDPVLDFLNKEFRRRIEEKFASKYQEKESQFSLEKAMLTIEEMYWLKRIFLETTCLAIAYIGLQYKDFFGDKDFTPQFLRGFEKHWRILIPLLLLPISVEVTWTTWHREWRKYKAWQLIKLRGGWWKRKKKVKFKTRLLQWIRFFIIYTTPFIVLNMTMVALMLIQKKVEPSQAKAD